MKQFSQEKIRTYIDGAAFGIFLAFLVIFHITMSAFGDDLYFSRALSQEGLWGFISNRYLLWSSRQVIEVAMILLMNVSDVLWKIADIAVCFSIPCTLNYLLGMPKGYRWVSAAIFWIYPMIDMSSAGWAATLTNYLWPLAFCLIAFSPLKKTLLGENMGWYNHLGCMAALIFAANQEQTCAILLGVYTLAAAYMLAGGKYSRPAVMRRLLPYYVVNGISLVYILTCPGNYIRKELEVSAFKDFPMFSLWDKAEFGFSSTINVMIVSALLIVLEILLILVIFKRPVKIWQKGAAVLPLVISAAFIIGRMCIEDENSNLYKFFNPVGTYGTLGGAKYFPPENYLPFICFGIYILCIVTTLISLDPDRWQWGVLLTVVFAAGLASRVIIGFTPTLWISGNRTFIFFYFAVIFCILKLWQYFLQLYPGKFRLGASLCLAVLGGGSGIYFLLL